MLLEAAAAGAVLCSALPALPEAAADQASWDLDPGPRVVVLSDVAGAMSIATALARASSQAAAAAAAESELGRALRLFAVSDWQEAWKRSGRKRAWKEHGLAPPQFVTRVSTAVRWLPLRNC